MASWTSKPRVPTRGPFAPGARVTLHVEAYGFAETGTLVANSPVSGEYGTYTLRLADGTLYRSEGRLS